MESIPPSSNPSIWQRIGCAGGFVIGFVVGFSTLFVLVLIFGDYDYETASTTDPPATVVAQQPAAQIATATELPRASDLLTFQQVCGVDEENMTDPQIEAHALRYANNDFRNWQGWVYDVVSRNDGTYDLEIAMEERGFFWGREIVVENIPQDLALQLNVEQPIVFDGRIDRVETTFEVMCNPMYVDNFSMQPD